MTWAAIGAAGVTAGVGALAGGSRKSRSGVTGPQVVTLPQYSFTESRLRDTSDFISGNLQNLAEGKYPTYYQQALPTLRENQSRGLKEAYFGSSGTTGGQGGNVSSGLGVNRSDSILGQIRSTGAALGTGPRAVIARENKALYDYANAEQEIDEYLTKIGVDIAQSDARFFTDASIRMPQGPSAQVIGGQAYSAPQPDYFGTAINQIGGALPGLLGSVFNKPADTSSSGGLLDYITSGGNINNVDRYNMPYIPGGGSYAPAPQGYYDTIRNRYPDITLSTSAR